ncbi:type II toxin-antitoxin system VapC family toxin [uncultured Thiodictyon sp.]|uniref:type II toxin-antitoxin system VapC family toxin n=1 Tax=uncultured Thiodictyon sp. TaxID=1846217 RepID=UPI0025CBE447|nr:type II toxin-antitoxin system VapC family toxin [uncultured Thiodictyon sp.]
MKSLDTNVLARFFIDDPDDAQAALQRPVAVTAMSAPALITVTVLLEFEWVMRGFYDLPRSEVARVLRALTGIGHILIEDRAAVIAALDAFDSGLDFADALHLARSQHASAFVTFDRRLAKRAGPLELMPKVEWLG